MTIPVPDPGARGTAESSPVPDTSQLPRPSRRGTRFAKKLWVALAAPYAFLPIGGCGGDVNLGAAGTTIATRGGTQTTATGGSMASGGIDGGGPAASAGGATGGGPNPAFGGADTRAGGGALTVGGTNSGGGAFGGAATGGTRVGGTTTGGTSTGGTRTGGIATGGTGITCIIGPTTYPAGTANPSNACQACQPSSSTSDWTPLPNGTDCGVGAVCYGGSCSNGCWIGATYYASDTVDPNSPCQVCLPTKSTVAWSNVACVGGKICQSSRCVCPSGLWECGDRCVDERSDNANCGGCGIICPSACRNGACIVNTGGTGSGGAPSGGTPGNGGRPSGTGGFAPCPGTGGPTMVRLPEGYCIDSTEVTRAQYAAWIATNPPTDEQISDCAWNTSFVPDPGCEEWAGVCQTGCDNHPQVCVDWCDAHAYCRAMNKRLCGMIGGGALSRSDWLYTKSSEWYNACVSGDANNIFPYGKTYQSGYCNNRDLQLETTVPVASMPDCQSSVEGYTGIYDLSGNVDEWQDACFGAGGMGDCYYQGGSFSSNWGYPSSPCDGSFGDYRSTARTFIGFRCCSD